MVTYTEIYNALNTNWNVAVIAKPTFANLNLTGDTKKLNTCVIGCDIVPFRTPMGFSGNFNKKHQNFSIQIVAASVADLALFQSEIIRILETTAVTSGYWRVRGEPLYREFNKWVYKQLQAEEIKVGSG